MSHTSHSFALLLSLTPNPFARVRTRACLRVLFNHLCRPQRHCSRTARWPHPQKSILIYFWQHDFLQHLVPEPKLNSPHAPLFRTTCLIQTYYTLHVRLTLDSSCNVLQLSPVATTQTRCPGYRHRWRHSATNPLMLSDTLPSSSIKRGT